MKKISQKIVHDGKWLSFFESVFETRDGERVVWEHVKRKVKGGGVVAIAQLMPSKRFILVKQYRPAANAYILGFPSGLADGVPEHALVELKEETGYTGKIIDISAELKTGGGVTSDSGFIVYIHVDESDPANHNPQQELESTEEIEVFLVAAEDMEEFLKNEYKNGTYVGANLWYLFITRKLFAR